VLGELAEHPFGINQVLGTAKADESKGALGVVAHAPAGPLPGGWLLVVIANLAQSRQVTMTWPAARRGAKKSWTGSTSEDAANLAIETGPVSTEVTRTWGAFPRCEATVS